jgi:hypothetical protein
MFKTSKQRKKVMAIYKVRENGHYFYTFNKPKTNKVFVPPYYIRKVKSIKTIKHPTTLQYLDAIGGY